jgi:hypothetical protein
MLEVTVRKAVEARTGHWERETTFHESECGDRGIAKPDFPPRSAVFRQAAGRAVPQSGTAEKAASNPPQEQLGGSCNGGPALGGRPSPPW